MSEFSIYLTFNLHPYGISCTKIAFLVVHFVCVTIFLLFLAPFPNSVPLNIIFILLLLIIIKNIISSSSSITMNVLCLCCAAFFDGTCPTSPMWPWNS